jgi:Transposase DDE domain
MKTAPKAPYRIRNWKEYDAALKQRGSITFWVSEEVSEQWNSTEKTGKRGASNEYSDLAMATMATVKSLFHLGGRQTEGFLESLFSLMQIELKAPDHSTLSRRLGKLSVTLPVVPKDKAVHVVVIRLG